MADVRMANAEQARLWSEGAGNWLEAEQAFEVVGRPLGELAMSLLPLAPGQRVLDIGCGTGATTVQLADRVSPGGEAVGADISPELLAQAGRRAGTREGLAFVVADAQTHDFGEAVFDAAYSRFGVMFFADPVAAFANIRRALRPGAPLAFVSWQPVFVNEWILVPAMAAVGVLGTVPTPPDPEAPGPFALSDVERVRGILGQADFRDVEVTPHSEPVVVPASDIDRLATASTRMGAVREMLQDADDETRGHVAEAVAQALRDRERGGEVRLVSAVLLVTARA